MENKQDNYLTLYGKSRSEVSAKSKLVDYAIEAYKQKKITKESVIKILKAVTM